MTMSDDSQQIRQPNLGCSLNGLPEYNVKFVLFSGAQSAAIGSYNRLRYIILGLARKVNAI